MTVKRTWTVENKWRCDSCGTENLGRFMECQNCRSAKEKQEADILSGPDAPEVKDAELLRLANQGANWVCEFCGGQVRNEHGKCVKNCGAPRLDNADLNELLVKPPSERVSTPSEPPRPVPRPLPTAVPGPGVSYRPSEASFPWGQVGIWGGGALGVLGLVWLGFFLFASHPEDTKVSGIAWTYRQDLHQRTTLHDEGWGSPIGAFNVSCKSKHYGTEDCHPHNCNAHSVSYECNCTSYDCNCRTTCTDNKNGFSSCSESCSSCQRCSTCSRTEYDTCYDQCDVYKDWCFYDYYEWPIIATKSTAGSTHDEHWADLKADGPLQRLDQSEAYEVQFKGKEDAWKYRPRNLTEFRYFNTGVTWKILVNRVGTVQPVQALP